MEVSVIIPTLNAGKLLRQLLEKILAQQFAGEMEIVVVDSFSEDKTLEIARRYTEKIFTRRFSNFSDQRQFAASQCSYDWVLHIDADEVVSVQLGEEIISTVPSEIYDAYYVPSINRTLGGWLKHGSWYPNYHIRLYRRSRGHWEGITHERLVVDCPCGYLKNPIIHYHDMNVSSYNRKTDEYTRVEVSLAEEMPRFILYRLTIRPLFVFFRNFILQGGILDGVRGLIICALRSMYEFILAAKLWEKFQVEQNFEDVPAVKVTMRVRANRLFINAIRHLNALRSKIRLTDH